MISPVDSITSSTGSRERAVPLSETERQRLLSHARAAARRAKKLRRPVLASITVALRPDIDATAVVSCGRASGEPWTVYEQKPHSVATLGVLLALEDSGSNRFQSVARRWAELCSEAITDSATSASGSGLVAAGGFAFSDAGASTPAWEGFAAASLHVPLISFAKDGRQASATINVLVGPSSDFAAEVQQACERVAQLPAALPPLLDPHPVQAAKVSSALSPSHYEDVVARAVSRIRSGAMEKIVLAREVLISGRRPADPAALLGVMREAYEGCCVLAVGRGEKTFLAATPELLVRRHGNRLTTLALAGTTSRSSDPAVEKHLGEQLLRSAKNRSEHQIVVKRILQRLDRISLWSAAADEPQVVKAASVQHLATPIRSQLREPVDVVTLAHELHPTPAVGGLPEEVALPLISTFEGLDRGWYAGPVGWIDAAGDGEFCVALRSALLEPEIAHCYAGVGVVADSDPAAELAETEVKLQALLPLLSA